MPANFERGENGAPCRYATEENLPDIYIYDEPSVYVMRKVLPGISMYDKTFLRNISEDSTYTRLRTVQG